MATDRAPGIANNQALDDFTLPRLTGQISPMLGLPVLDATAHLAQVDWTAMGPPRADDAGIETDDGRRLVTAESIEAWFAEVRDQA